MNTEFKEIKRLSKLQKKEGPNFNEGIKVLPEEDRKEKFYQYISKNIFKHSLGDT
jgi:DNA-binding ferritin-like protein (Dps family)